MQKGKFKPMYKNPYENLNNGEWMKTNFHTHAGTGEIGRAHV